MDRHTQVKGLLCIASVTLAGLAVIPASALYPEQTWIVLGIITTLVPIVSGYSKMIERLQVRLGKMSTATTRS